MTRQPTDSKTNKPVSVRGVFKRRSGQLDRLLTTTARLRQLNTYVLRLLPQPLAEHCQVAGIHNNTLIIYTDSTAWATRLRMAVPGLLKSVRAKGIRQIEARVQPASPVPVRRKKKPPTLSQNSANHLSSMAKTIKDDKLREALERLARHGKDT